MWSRCSPIIKKSYLLSRIRHVYCVSLFRYIILLNHLKKKRRRIIFGLMPLVFWKVTFIFWLWTFNFLKVTKFTVFTVLLYQEKLAELTAQNKELLTALERSKEYSELLKTYLEESRHESDERYKEILRYREEINQLKRTQIYL